MNPSEWVESYKQEHEYRIPDYKINRLINFESEFDSLKYELEGYKLLCARLIGVARFYGRRESWTFSYAMNRKTNFREITGWDTYFIAHSTNKQGAAYGGKLARKALCEFQGQIGRLEEEMGVIPNLAPSGFDDELNEIQE